MSPGSRRIICLTAHTTETLVAPWCGTKFKRRRVPERSGRQEIAAVRHGRLLEIKCCDILQPGLAALSDGLRRLRKVTTRCAQKVAHPGAAGVNSADSTDPSGRREPP